MSGAYERGRRRAYVTAWQNLGVVWRNWSRTQEASPAHVVRPRSTDDLATTVARATEAGLRVKPVGAGHSFTGIAVTDGVQLDLSAMRGITDVDGNRVTVLPGTPLHELNDALAELGLALANLGDIDLQTITGAIATGTHGTGNNAPSLPAQVCGLEVVGADGSVIRCSAEERPNVFEAARIGLGAVGVISSLTLECVPAFNLHAVERPMRLDEVLTRLDEMVVGNDHFEFYWFPHTSGTLTKQNNRVPMSDPPRPLGKVRRWVDDELLSNRVFEVTNRLCAGMPLTTGPVNRIAARALTAREFADRSDRVFCSSRRVVFREMEYAIPRAALPDVLGEIGRWIDRSGEKVSFPLEVRFGPAESLWLSTAYERETAYVAAHMFHRVPYERYFHAVEGIMHDVDGRPHWGKLHWLDADQLASLYPRLGDFRRIRNELDPAGAFVNPYLERVLGRLF